MSNEATKWWKETAANDNSSSSSQEVKWHFNSIAWLWPSFEIISHQPVSHSYTLAAIIPKIKCLFFFFVYIIKFECAWDLWVVVNCPHPSLRRSLRAQFRFKYTNTLLHEMANFFLLLSNLCNTHILLISSIVEKKNNRWWSMKICVPIENAQEQSDCIEYASVYLFFCLQPYTIISCAVFFFHLAFTIHPQRIRTINDIALMPANNIVQRK